MPQQNTAPHLTLPRFFLIYLGALVALGPVGMDAYLPALPTMAEALNVPIATLAASVSTFLVGFALGQLLGGPISDQIGRKRVCVIGTGLFVATSAAIAASDSAGLISALRFVQAFGGGFATITAMAQVRDAYPAEQIGHRFATVMMVMMIAPVIAPLIGTGLLHFNWRAIFVFQVLYGCIMLALMWRLIPETLQGEPQPASLRRVFTQYGAILLHRTRGQLLAARFALCMGSAAGVLLIFVTHASFTYMEFFGVSETAFSLLFGLNAIGLIGANSLSAKLLKVLPAMTVFRYAIGFQLTLVTLLTVLALTGALTLWMAVPLIVLSVGVVGVINPAGMARFMGMFESRQGGSAAAIQMVSMFSMGSGMGALASVFYDGTLAPIVGVMLVSMLLSVGLLLTLGGLNEE